ncbi:uncharacterized protein LOC122069978 [Macadamia integrifolia]|uniref:uncharacterized protein LOC122069978 n=1 Tax=Macadamia integrifolia TaxID=60698 RepID=UPI001C4F71B3|nr:uncharacterized protein LOC122069978 [Macadamia integrifolia]
MEKRMSAEENMVRKRKSNPNNQLFSFPPELDHDSLALSLSPPSTRLSLSPPSTRRRLPPPHSPILPLLPLPRLPPPPAPTLPPYQFYLSPLIVDSSSLNLVTSSPTSNLVTDPSVTTTLVAGSSTSTSTAHPEHNTSYKSRTRRNPTQAPRAGKSDTIPAPYPWATTLRATVHSLEHLLQSGLHTISGECRCKECDQKDTIMFDLQSKFFEVANFIAVNNSKMHDRAPNDWNDPLLPTCKYCEKKNSVKPIINKKKEINWLFLFLGQMLGCCNLEQLKYFCKHTKNHRTGAKDRVLYLTYLTICKQLFLPRTFDP